MILLDTSAWIRFLSKNDPFKLSPLQLERVCICPPVYQEVLQGIRDDRAWNTFQSRLRACFFLDQEIPLERFEAAAQLYRLGRKQGITIRSAQDCLIAAIAIHHQVPILHFDRDYDQIAKISHLQIAHQV